PKPTAYEDLWKEVRACGLASLTSPYLESDFDPFGNPSRFQPTGNCSSRAAQARHYLEVYQAFPSADPNKVKYIGGWMAKAAGDTQGAISTFYDLDCSDARTSVLAIIGERDGNTAAIEWLADNRPYDHGLLNPVGWRNAVVMMAENSGWAEGLRTLEVLPTEMKEICPDLLFVEGVLHAGFLLPEPIRAWLLKDSNIDFKGSVQGGAAATGHRNAAIVALKRARELMLKLGAEKRANGCEYHLTWLRLTDPAEREAAMADLIERMKDGEFAAFVLDIALNFEVPFDREPLERYLRRRKREGREAPQDQAAKLRLLQHFGTPSDVLAHLEREENTLEKVLTPTTLAALKIHAITNDGRIADAEKELERCGELFSPEERERFHLMFSDRKGHELEGLEALYSRTGDYDDLLNLVRYLERSQQWNSLIPHARTLLGARRSTSTLRILIHAMQKANVPNNEITDCAAENRDLIVANTPEGDDVLLAEGWALFGLGKFVEAQQIAEDLAIRTHGPGPLSLEINVALRTGQWEHFPTIIDREYPRLHELPSNLLLQMASVIADREQERAIEIAGIAANRDPADGVVQANAYWLASQIGREIDASLWLKRAIELSERGEGPLQSVSLREMVEAMPARAEQRREWERQYASGELGIHPAATLLNIPIAQILVGEALRNERESDPRRRSVIPVRHGGRRTVDLTGVHKLAFDLSSLLILENLDVLQSLLDALEGVLLSPRLMDLLFVEHRQVRFHQPSLVEEAKRIREMIANTEIRLLQNVRPPRDLVKEVGEEMACLLHMAHTSGGRVLSTLPVPKVGSLEQDTADLGQYGQFILKTTQLLPAFKNVMTADEYDKAMDFLSSVDRGEKLGPDDLGKGPLYVDNLALRYVDTAGILYNLRCVGCDVFVSASVGEDAKELIEGAHHGAHVAVLIDRLRKRIRDSVRNKKVTFLPESSHRENHDMFHHTNALLDLFDSVGDGDGVCVDDRVIGKHASMTDRQGRNVPIVGAVDVLEHLLTQDVITKNRKESCDFRLRKWGFAFLPLDPDFLLAALKEAADVEQGRFVENRDLIAIRENVQRIRSTKILRFPDEGTWFWQMAEATRWVISQIWTDATIGPKMAESVSDWVLDMLAPLPTSWQDSVMATEEEVNDPTKIMLLQFISLGMTLKGINQREAYAKWVDRRLVQPLLMANLYVVEELSLIIGRNVSKIAKDIADESE
ncbi:MAG: hypothetical protein IH626_04435, partial [Rhodospirillales bacterium]|nr:hypothetical protein [Rhodospirillales bacterium]